MIRVYSSHIHIQFLQDGFSHGKNYFLKPLKGNLKLLKEIQYTQLLKYIILIYNIWKISKHYGKTKQ